jgi:4-amino-4-deoxy-L-arabinose transferase-like glycosyltransferase
LAAVFALYHIGLQLYDPRSALAAAALFSSGFLVLGEVHLAKTDTVLMALALAQQWALMQLYLAWQNDQPPPRHGWLWFWLAMAAGILVKGPVLPVLALLSVAALCLWHRQFRWLAIIPVLARVCHHSCFMFAMGAFGIGGNGWRLSVNSDIR